MVIRKLVSAVGIAALTATLTACTGTPPQLDLVRVPADAATLQEAAERVAPDGVIEIADGHYTETLAVGTDGVTVRGESRDGVIIDGEGKRSTGITLSGANVTVENLTVTAHLVTGILITGIVDESGLGLGRPRDGYAEPADTEPPLVEGYAVRYTTTTNNGLYGIYAFNRTAGVISDNYSSGSADSGIYVGQCDPCAAIVRDNVAELNAIGLEMANASDVTVVGNRFSSNRIGASIQSNYQEAYLPMHSVRIVGNVVTDNDEALTPAVAEGGFGVGIALSGITDAEVRSNRISGNPYLGIALTVERDIGTSDVGLGANGLTANGIDLAAWGSSQASVENVCTDSLPARTFPTQWPESACAGTGVFGTDALSSPVVAPEGISFLDVSLPGTLPSLPDEMATDTHPWLANSPETPSAVPPADLFSELLQRGARDE